jgi:hypothetical protein
MVGQRETFYQVVTPEGDEQAATSDGDAAEPRVAQARKQR